MRDWFNETKIKQSELERLQELKKSLADAIGDTFLSVEEDKQLADICAHLEQLETEKTKQLQTDLKFFFKVA